MLILTVAAPKSLVQAPVTHLENSKTEEGRIHGVRAVISNLVTESFMLYGFNGDLTSLSVLKLVL